MGTYSERVSAAREFLKLIPFEHTLRGGSVDSLQARLLAEHNLFSDIAWPMEKAPRFRLLLMLEECNGLPEAVDTLRCWALQSFPDCESVVTVRRATLVDDFRERLRSDPIFSILPWHIDEDASLERLAAEPGVFLIFARPGDFLHPSLAATLALRIQTAPRDVFVWNCGCYTRTTDGSLRFAALLRRPQLQQITLLNHDYIGRSFAVRASIVAEFSDRRLERFWDDGGHTLKIWLAKHARMGWETHPEYLTLFPEQDAQGHGAASAAALPAYREVVEDLIGSPVEEASANMDVPRWAPCRQAQSVSVVIPFRDQPELTVRAIASVCAQRFDGEIEVVLVNNQSADITLAVLARGLSRLGERMRVTRVDYQKAFNHSRQCNLGADAAHGDVVVFLNNDTELASPDLLDGVCRWSGLDGVATVGCRIESHSGVLVCAGLKARLNAGYDYHSMVEENRDLQYSHIVREVVGNTFACAAIRRDTFRQLGGLDESDFPIGYNDVEFCLRALEKNYRHLYLGHLVLRHEPGTSRGKSDELYQKVLIRERYPWVVREGMFQLENDHHLLRGSQKTGAARAMALALPLGSTNLAGLLRQALGRLAR